LTRHLRHDRLWTRKFSKRIVLEYLRYNWGIPLRKGNPMMIDAHSPVIEFTAADRCDRCGAQAMVLAKSEDTGSELQFCAHCVRENKDHLRDDGWFFVADGVEAEKQGYTPDRLETLLV
jgi:ribosomal protein S14